MLYNRDDAPINKECELLVKMLLEVISSGGDLNPVLEYAEERNDFLFCTISFLCE